MGHEGKRVARVGSEPATAMHGALHCLSLFSSPDQCLVREGDLCNNRNGNIMTMVLVLLLLFKGG